MSKEVIRLTLPAKVEYVMTARLVISAIFGQQGFDVDDIEDAKAAISEACLLLMPEKGQAAEISMEVWAEDGVRAIISTPGRPACGQDAQEREFSIFLLEALTDECVYEQTGETHAYKLYKAIQS